MVYDIILKTFQLNRIQRYVYTQELLREDQDIDQVELCIFQLIDKPKAKSQSQLNPKRERGIWPLACH